MENHQRIQDLVMMWHASARVAIEEPLADGNTSNFDESFQDFLQRLNAMRSAEDLPPLSAQRIFTLEHEMKSGETSHPSFEAEYTADRLRTEVLTELLGFGALQIIQGLLREMMADESDSAPYAEQYIHYCVVWLNQSGQRALIQGFLEQLGIGGADQLGLLLDTVDPEEPETAAWTRSIFSEWRVLPDALSPEEVANFWVQLYGKTQDPQDLLRAKEATRQVTQQETRRFALMHLAFMSGEIDEYRRLIDFIEQLPDAQRVYGYHTLQTNLELAASRLPGPTGGAKLTWEQVKQICALIPRKKWGQNIQSAVRRVHF